jgi:uncharacterized protein (TIGR02271 family)
MESSNVSTAERPGDITSRAIPQAKGHRMTNVVGLFETREQVNRAMEALKAAGLKAEDMSIVMRDSSIAADVADTAGADSAGSDAVGAGAVGGGLIGGVAGLMVGLGALTIPGIGPLLAAGPLATALAGGAVGATAGGMVGALVGYGLSEDEAKVYSTGLERGGILLTVKTPKKREAEVRRILEANGMRDADYHRSRWEEDPDFRYDIERTSDMNTNKTRTENRDKAKVDGKAGGTAVGGTAGAIAGAAVGGPVGAAVGAVAGSAIGGAAGSAFDYKEVEPELRGRWESSHKGKGDWEKASPAYRYGWESYQKPEYEGKSWEDVSSHLAEDWSGKGKWAEAEPYIREAWETRAQRSINSGGEAVVPVVEEELAVGKRKINKGGVKVSTKVTETPVEERVHLHEEHVEVHRRPATRAATAKDTAFREGTLELTETAEEAVVSKRARVVEEVVIKKEGRDKTQAVKDTVRRTDVDVIESDEGFDAHDIDFRAHHKRHFGKGGSTYESYAPAYRFGYDLAGDKRYAGDWTTIEPEVRKSWEKSHKGTWEQFKDAVRHGWEKITGRR